MKAQCCSPALVLLAAIAAGAALHAAAHWVAPLLFAIFLALISAPVLSILHRGKVPWAVGIVLLLGLVGVAFYQLFSLLESTARQLIAAAPHYQARMEQLIGMLQGWLELWPIPSGELVGSLWAWLASAARSLASAAGGLLAHFALVLLAYFLLLWEIPTLPQRLQAAFPSPRYAVRARRLMRAANRYLLIKTTISVLTGVAVWLLLIWRSIDFAAFLAVLAGLLNFIPTLGSLLAALPAVFLALLMGGIEEGLIVAAGYLVINILLGNILEPRWMGSAVGLSPTVVLISLLLWGWLLGLVGAFLSIPLTMLAQLALASYPATRPYAALLGYPSSGLRSG